MQRAEKIKVKLLCKNIDLQGEKETTLNASNAEGPATNRDSAIKVADEAAAAAETTEEDDLQADHDQAHQAVPDHVLALDHAL
jgi:hypothetical protein